MMSGIRVLFLFCLKVWLSRCLVLWCLVLLVLGLVVSYLLRCVWVCGEVCVVLW